MKEQKDIREDTGMREPTGTQETAKTAATGDSQVAAECRRGPGWKGWVLSILVAVILSVTTTLLLCGSGAFRSVRAVASGAGGVGHGTGDPCCPPVASGK
ncbi:MAG: hypothetical protein PHP88_01795 [bacterium]|nr:hypothetical protein [bacterium]